MTSVFLKKIARRLDIFFISAYPCDEPHRFSLDFHKNYDVRLDHRQTLHIINGSTLSENLTCY